MTRIIVDQALRSKLNNLTEPLELCDESGQVLAQILPVSLMAQFERWEPPITEEELRRRESEESYTTEQVLAHLKSLEKQ